MNNVFITQDVLVYQVGGDWNAHNSADDHDEGAQVKLTQKKLFPLFLLDEYNDRVANAKQQQEAICHHIDPSDDRDGLFLSTFIHF